jgi:SRSO17 transposase
VTITVATEGGQAGELYQPGEWQAYKTKTKEDDYSPELMTEFIRDIVANCFGIYHIVSMESF